MRMIHTGAKKRKLTRFAEGIGNKIAATTRHKYHVGGTLWWFLPASQQPVNRSSVLLLVLLGPKLQNCSRISQRQLKQLRSGSRKVVDIICSRDSTLCRWHHRWRQISDLQNKLLLAGNATWGWSRSVVDIIWSWNSTLPPYRWRR